MPRLALHWQILLAMLLGAAIGVAVNMLAGRRTMEAKAEYPGGRPQLLEMPAPVPIEPSRVWARDSPERTLIQIDTEVPQPPGGQPRYHTRRMVVGQPPDPAAGPVPPIEWPELPPQVEADAPVAVEYFPTLKDLKAGDPAAYVLFHMYGRSKARALGDLADTLGQLFLRMLMMVSIPLIVTSLITGITGLGHAEQLGRMFGRTIVYYLTTSLLAILTGLLMVNLIRPGIDNVPPPAPAAPAAGAEAAAADQPPPDQDAGRGGRKEGKSLLTVLFEQVQTMIPTNPFEALARAEFLSVIAFSLFFGVCTILVGGRTAEVIGGFFSAAFDVMMTMTMFIIRLAPFGVFFLMLSATASQGLGVFGTLGWYMATVACALLIHAVIVLPLILHFVARRSPWRYAQAMSPALVTAFSSASSNGTLPLTLTCVEERAGISNRVGSFVLPLGATINMDGTALYEVVAVLFIAQYSGIELSLAQQIIVAFTALLASIGAAGIPHAGLVMMIIILQAVELPTESQGLIIAVDRVLDMCRTAVNVWSDSCGCAVVARFEADGPPAPVPSGGEATVDI